MDSTTVDYAIAKLNEAFAAIQPIAVDLGSQYIDYIVFKVVLTALGLVILWPIAGFILYWAIRKMNDHEEEWLIPVILVSAIGTVLCTIATPINLYRMALALYSPLMFTIEQLAK